MKNICNENGKEKVYVQLNDLSYLTHTDLPIPVSIYMKAIDNNLVTDENKHDFVKFEEAHEIVYFKNLDFIIDYNEYKNMSLDELQAKVIEISVKMLTIATTYNDMSSEEKARNQDMLEDHKNLEYMSKNILDLYMAKSDSLNINLPMVEDEKYFKLVSDDDCPYEMCGTVDPNVILLYRKDGQALTNKDIIPQGFYQSGLSIAIMERQKDDQFFGDFSTNNHLSDDKKQLIITFETKNYEEKDPEPEKEKGIKKLVKSLFKRKPLN